MQFREKALSDKLRNKQAPYLVSLYFTSYLKYEENFINYFLLACSYDCLKLVMPIKVKGKVVPLLFFN